jgi:hypothetical protein
MTSNEEESSLTLDKKTVDVLEAQIIPTSKYFEVRFDQVIASIERPGDKLDYRDEKQRGFTLRMFTIAIGISILGAPGAFLKSMGII